MKKKIILSIIGLLVLVLSFFVIKGAVFLKNCNEKTPIVKYLNPLTIKEKVIVLYNYIKIMNRHREKAYSDLGKLIKENPNIAAYHYLLGFTGYNFIGNPECFTDAIRIIPNDSNLYYQRGIAYQNFAVFENAISDFDKALELDPNNPIIYIKRAEAKISMNGFRTTVRFNNSFRKQDLFDYEGALEDIKKAIELDKSYEYLLYEFYGYKAQRKLDYKTAEENYTKAIELNKKTDSSYRKMALAFFYKEDDKNAISNLVKASKKDKNNVFNYVDMADIQKNYLMDYKSAIKSYDKVIKLEGEQAEFFQKRAECEFYLRKFKNAIKDFNKALKSDPDNPAIYYSRGRTKRELGDYKGALSDFEKALKLNPNNKEIKEKIEEVKKKL